MPKILGQFGSIAHFRNVIVRDGDGTADHVAALSCGSSIRYSGEASVGEDAIYTATTIFMITFIMHPFASRRLPIIQHAIGAIGEGQFGGVSCIVPLLIGAKHEI